MREREEKERDRNRYGHWKDTERENQSKEGE